MEREADPKDPPKKDSEQPEPPPFDPDPRLITELERGRRRIEKDRVKKA
jgi:hypothetical protein